MELGKPLTVQNMDLGKTVHDLRLIMMVNHMYGNMPDVCKKIITKDWFMCSRILFESMDEHVENLSRNISRSLWK